MPNDANSASSSASRLSSLFLFRPPELLLAVLLLLLPAMIVHQMAPEIEDKQSVSRFDDDSIDSRFANGIQTCDTAVDCHCSFLVALKVRRQNTGNREQSNCKGVRCGSTVSFELQNLSRIWFRRQTKKQWILHNNSGNGLLDEVPENGSGQTTTAAMVCILFLGCCICILLLVFHSSCCCLRGRGDGALMARALMAVGSLVARRQGEGMRSVDLNQCIFWIDFELQTEEDSSRASR